jgi:hypothetical protein
VRLHRGVIGRARRALGAYSKETRRHKALGRMKVSSIWTIGILLLAGCASSQTRMETASRDCSQFFDASIDGPYDVAWVPIATESVPREIEALSSPEPFSWFEYWYRASTDMWSVCRSPGSTNPCNSAFHETIDRSQAGTLAVSRRGLNSCTSVRPNNSLKPNPLRGSA